MGVSNMMIIINNSNINNNISSNLTHNGEPSETSFVKFKKVELVRFWWSLFEDQGDSTQRLSNVTPSRV